MKFLGLKPGDIFGSRHFRKSLSYYYLIANLTEQRLQQPQIRKNRYVAEVLPKTTINENEQQK
jgi:hypothetical protein